MEYVGLRPRCCKWILHSMKTKHLFISVVCVCKLYVDKSSRTGPKKSIKRGTAKKRRKKNILQG